MDWINRSVYCINIGTKTTAKGTRGTACLFIETAP